MLIQELLERMMKKGGNIFVLKDNELATDIVKVVNSTGSVEQATQSVINDLSELSQIKHMKGLENIVKCIATTGILGFLEGNDEAIASVMVVEDEDYAVVFVLKNELSRMCYDQDVIVDLIKNRHKDPRTFQPGPIIYSAESFCRNLITPFGFTDNLRFSWGYIKPALTKAKKKDKPNPELTANAGLYVAKPNIIQNPNLERVHDRETVDNQMDTLSRLCANGWVLTPEGMERSHGYTKGEYSQDWHNRRLDLSELETALTEIAKDNNPPIISEMLMNHEIHISMATEAKIIGAKLGELMSCRPEYQQQLIDVIVKTIKL